MAKIHGSNALVKFDSNTLEMAEWTLNWSNELADVTVFGNDSRRRISGLSDCSGTVKGPVDTSQLLHSGSLAYVPGDSTTIKLYINATQYYQFDALIETFDVSAPVDGIVEISCTFQGNGDVTPPA